MNIKLEKSPISQRPPDFNKKILDGRDILQQKKDRRNKHLAKVEKAENIWVFAVTIFIIIVLLLCRVDE